MYMHYMFLYNISTQFFILSVFLAFVYFCTTFSVLNLIIKKHYLYIICLVYLNDTY